MRSIDPGLARRGLILTGITAVLVSGGIVIGGRGGSPAAASVLPAFDNCTTLQQWVTRAAAKEQSGAGGGATYGTVMGGPIPVDGMVRGALGAAEGLAIPAPKGASGTTAMQGSAGAATDAVGSSATGTNVQEVGVDEPDQVKTDGSHIVGITNGRLWVAELRAGVPRVIGRLKLNGWASSLLLDGSRALVLTTGGPVGIYGGPAVDLPAIGAAGESVPSDVIRPYDGRSQLVAVDLSQPRSPRVIATQTVTGTVLTARQVGDVAWVVTQSQPAVRPLPRNKPNTLLPGRTVRDGRGVVVADGALLPCSSVRHPIKLAGSQLLTVQPVDLTAASPFTKGRAAGVIASGGLVYASAHRLYVATTTWGSTANTQIHAFDISDGKRASYVGSGTVPGTLLSQWAMSEQDGYLRVASTRGDVVPPPGEGLVPSRSRMSESLVTVLAERGSRLVQVGQVGGLGRGERVWAVRWLGDLAAVVTFKQTDPLYLLDVSEPTNPRVLGELKITGYSAYLHPVGDGLLLGIGHEADARGRIGDMKATLFDVRDPAHPRAVDSLDLGLGGSNAEGDSHAFTYLPVKRLALLPLFSDDGTVARSIQVSTSGLSEAGRLVGGNTVQRFLPVGNAVVALGMDRLLSVDATTLNVLGVAALQ